MTRNMKLYHTNNMDMIGKNVIRPLAAIIMTSTLGFLPLLSSCSEDDFEDVKPEAVKTGTFVDERDGFVYHYAQFGDTDWMLDNGHYKLDNEMKCAAPLSAQESESNIYTYEYVPRYGYCYTLTGAKEACPEGWRVPTDEDWQKLEMQYGMSKSEAQRREWRGSCAYSMRELSNDSTTLGILMTGYYTSYTTMQTPEFRLMGSFGFFWTSTPDEEKENEYFYRKFAYNKKEVWRESTEDGHVMMFVRYCRDAKEKDNAETVL